MNCSSMLFCPVLINLIASIFHKKDIPAFPYYFMLGLTVIAWVGVFLRRLLKRKPKKAFVFGKGFIEISTFPADQQAYIRANYADGYELATIESLGKVTAATAAASASSNDKPKPSAPSAPSAPSPTSSTK